jgi:phosphatidylglycerophosphatase A
MQRSQPVVAMPQSFLDRSLTIVATGGFSGYSGIVPGTVGSLVGLLLYLPLAGGPRLVGVVATTVLFILGVFASSRMEEI